jgi:hypothetical protein
VYNIPRHEAIGNLKRLCVWLEELRRRYNDKYVVVKRDFLDEPSGKAERSTTLDMTTPSLSSRPSVARGEISEEEPIRINSGYRSPQLNKAIHGNANSNHMTGCACDIRVSGMEQALRYAVILMDYADESKQEFDELLIEKNRYGAIWLHFAVRPANNRRKILFINA